MAVFRKAGSGIKTIPFIICCGSYVIMQIASIVAQGTLLFGKNVFIAIVLLCCILLPFPAFLFWVVVSLLKMLKAVSFDGFNGLDTMILLSLFASTVFYLSLAIWVDSIQNNHKSSKMSQTMARANTYNQLTIPSINREYELAKENRNDIPVQASQIFKQFSNHGINFFALKDVNLIVNKGESVGLLGPNGAGKSTLFNVLSTYHGITAGNVKFFGETSNSYSSFFKEAGICTQDDILWESLSVNDHLEILAGMKNVPPEHIPVWKDLVGLNGFGKFKADTLSNGMKRKLCFLMACISNPQYKFLDECTTGLDPLARKIFKNIIDKQKEIYGASCIFTTHTMNEAEKTCDRVAILINGEVVALDDINELKKQMGGYSLTLVKLENQESLVREMKEGEHFFDLLVQRRIVQFLPNSFRRVVEKKFEVLYDLPAVSDLPGIFEELNAAVDEGEIKDFSVKMKDLEDLFLQLAAYQMPRMVGH